MDKVRQYGRGGQENRRVQLPGSPEVLSTLETSKTALRILPEVFGDLREESRVSRESNGSGRNEYIIKRRLVSQSDFQLLKEGN